jgi:oligoendopeptidase F
MKNSSNREMLKLLVMTMLVISLFSISSLGASKAIPQRSDIEDKYKWDLDDLYSSDEAWEVDFKFLDANIERMAQFQGKLGESSDMLLQCLQLKDSLELIEHNLWVYGFLKLDENNRESKYQEMTQRMQGLWSRMSSHMSYIQPELLAISNDRLLGFLNANIELDIYRFYLEDLVRQKEHILSEKEEAIMSLVSPVASAPSSIFSMINDADMDYGTIVDDDGEEIQLTKQRYYRLMETAGRDVRRTANHAYNTAYLNRINTLAATLASSIKKDYFFMKARGYNSCLEMGLDADNIPPEVFHSLVKAVNDNLAPLHKLTSIRKRVLGYDTLYNYDLSVPLVPEAQKEYPYEEAKELVLKGLEPMGKEYLAAFKEGLESRWIDVYETDGKGSGAYQWGTYATHPFILLNHNNTLNSVFTIAHEMGHAMHSYYTHKNEPFIYGSNTLFVAEVASTCNEAVLMKYWLEHSTDKMEKIALLNYYIEQIMGTFYTQVMFSEFEIATHEIIEEGGALSADQMRKIYRDIYQKYWGPELVLDSLNDMGCMRIGHFYRQYYVYKYATSYAAAQMMSQRILEDPKYLDTYVNFLSTGTSKYPVDILKDAGVDVTATEPVERTIALFSDLVDELEVLLLEN